MKKEDKGGSPKKKVKKEEKGVKPEKEVRSCYIGILLAKNEFHGCKTLEKCVLVFNQKL